jgi:hypothetical protein
MVSVTTIVACAQARTSAPLCTGAQLNATFKPVLGSAGAGNIVYRLVITNKSTAACSVTGLPRGTLLTKLGKVNPTRIRAAFPQGLTAVLVTLATGKSAQATARFSPDVNGTGDHMGIRCQPLSYWFRVAAPGGGTVKAKVTPATSVCERGTLSFRAYSRL